MKKIILSTLLASSLVMAAEVYTNDDELVTHTEFGYVNTQGNTNTTALGLDAKINKSFDKHVFEIIFDGQYATDTGTETKNKYFTELTYDYEITEKFSFGYLVGYKKDLFSDYDFQFYTGPGGKYKLMKTHEDELKIEGNLLYSKDKFSDTDYDALGHVIAYPNAKNIVVARTASGRTKNYAAYRAKAIYTRKILENLKFSQELSYRSEVWEATNFFIFSKTSIVNKISNMFSAGINYKVDYVNLAGAGKDQTDRTLSANVIVDF